MKSEKQKTKESKRNNIIKELYLEGINPQQIKEKGYSAHVIYKALKTIPGYPLRKHTTSMSDNPIKKLLHSKWTQMKQRCYYEGAHNFQYYGGKGVQICDEWYYNFDSFYEWSIANGYKKGMAISRHGDTGDYSPENCVYKTMRENTKDMIDKYGKRIKVICVDTDTTFDSSYEAAKWLNSIGIINKEIIAGSGSNIIAQGKKGKKAYGYSWKIVEEK